MLTDLLRHAHWCNSGIDVTEETEPTPQEASHAWSFIPRPKPMTEEIINPMGEPIIIIGLLNGSIKLSSKDVSLYPYISAAFCPRQRSFIFVDSS